MGGMAGNKRNEGKELIQRGEQKENRGRQAESCV